MFTNTLFDGLFLYFNALKDPKASYCFEVFGGAQPLFGTGMRCKHLKKLQFTTQSK